MLLVDKNIKELVKNGLLIVTNYKEENVTPISYDLTIDCIVKEDENKTEHILKPKEFVMIKTNEELQIPNNILGRIGEKNSLMRMGLCVSGPHYQPGHRTCCYLRVYNMSDKEITLKRNLKIAQIIFEMLQEVPSLTYDKIEKSSFNNEKSYLGFGKYTDEYKKIIK